MAAIGGNNITGPVQSLGDGRRHRLLPQRHVHRGLHLIVRIKFDDALFGPPGTVHPLIQTQPQIHHGIFRY